MTRRSARIKEKAEASGSGFTAVSTTHPEETDDFDVDGSNSEGERVIRPKKRSKTSGSAKGDGDGKHVHKKYRGNRGILQELREMPLDILFEIFGQLYPIDLLNLARTTKALRAVLMSRSAVTVWQRGRITNIPGLPDCPKNLSEPQYADLLFNSHCQACPASTSQAIVWGLLIRLCSTCIDRGFLNWKTSRYRYPQLPTDIAELVPKVLVNSFQGKKRCEKVFHDETQRRWLQEYQELPNETAISAWYSELQSNYERLSAFAERCEEWSDQRARDRAQALRQIQLQRKNDIFNKLRELGWGDELEKHDIKMKLESHFFVRQKRPLTDRLWVKMKPVLLEFLENAKAEHLLLLGIKRMIQGYSIIKQIREQFISTCSLDMVVPPVTDILFFEPFQSVALANQNLTLEHFGEVMEQLPQFCKDWREEKDRELVEMIAKVLSDVVVDHSHLLLASTFFKAGFWYLEEPEPLPYPHVLASRHATPVPIDHGIDTIHSILPEAGWNTYKVISFNKQAFEQAIIVIQACLYDPKTTTAEVIDSADPILECLLCAKPGARCCMTWRRAVYHAYKLHKSTQASWLLVEEPFAGEIRKRIVEAHIGNRLSHLKSSSSLYCCAHCKERFHSKELLQHLLSKHGKTTYSNEDFIKTVDQDYTPPNVYYVNTKWVGRIR